ncbi:MAG: hypothetical protein GY811_10675 [Myxococcales bacterium]|nr:hypothetical protein [Myxococcales bacterium]
MLRSLTSAELMLLRQIYLEGDAYEIFEASENAGQLHPPGILLIAAPRRLKEWREDVGSPGLLQLLTERSGLDGALVEPVAAKLDSRSLSNIIVNAAAAHGRVMSDVPLELLAGAGVGQVFAVEAPQYQGTPIELSRTAFGHQFIDFVKG